MQGCQSDVRPKHLPHDQADVAFFVNFFHWIGISTAAHFQQIIVHFCDHGFPDQMIGPTAAIGVIVLGGVAHNVACVPDEITKEVEQLRPSPDSPRIL